jgi:hypothetical protein
VGINGSFRFDSENQNIPVSSDPKSGFHITVNIRVSGLDFSNVLKNSEPNLECKSPTLLSFDQTKVLHTVLEFAC